MRGLTLITSVGFLGSAAGILVAENSPCGTLCGNVLDATTTDDVVCREEDYTSGAGVVYQQCVACELSSNYQTADNETDQQWLLYNVRYATSYCLFGVPENDAIINTPCLTSKACGPFRDAIIYNNLSSNIENYDYCDLWPVTDTLDFVGCTECLQAGDRHFLANFITLLQAGCEQQPAPGATVAIEGNLFSKDDVNVTNPTLHPTMDSKWLDKGPLTLQAKVGIAVGGFVLVLFILGFCIVWRGKRRRKAFLRTLEMRQESRWPNAISIPHETRDTPLSQKPLRTWDESPVSVRSEKPFSRYVSPYSSQYNSPVSATELKLANWPVINPHDQMYPPNHDSPRIGVALGGDESSINTSSSKGKERQQEEAYEMHPVHGVHGGIGVYHPGQSNQAHPQQGYFPEFLVHPDYAYGSADDGLKRGHAP